MLTLTLTNIKGVFSIQTLRKVMKNHFKMNLMKLLLWNIKCSLFKLL